MVLSPRAVFEYACCFFLWSVQCQGLEGVSYRLTTKEEDEADLLDIGNPIEEEKEDDIWGRTDAQPSETLEFLQRTMQDRDQDQEPQPR